MGNANKDKGKRVEREVCELLKNVFGLSFQRIPNSGAFVGGLNVSRLATMSDSQILLHRGDIIPPDELHNLIVECKGRQKFAFHQLLQGKGSADLDEWIDQVEVDWNAGDRKGFYCVVFKPNNLGFFVCYDVAFHIYDVFTSGHQKLTEPRNGAIYKHGDKSYVVSELTKEWLAENKDWFLRKCSK